MTTALATPFYLDMGYSKTEIGLIAKNAGLWPSVLGGLIGGLWMIKLGINKSLWVFGAVQMVAILGFAWLADAATNPTLFSSFFELQIFGASFALQERLVWLAMVIGVEALGVGLGTAAFVAYIAKTTHPLYTATQFALFTSLAAVPRTFANAATGYMVESMGWRDFFILCFLIAIPGMALLLKIAPWNETAKDIQYNN
jgi:PAT family beta-lactamase induction signal transducer AmpG